MPCDISDRETIDGTKYALVQNGVASPVEYHIACVGPVSEQIYRQIDERKGHPIIAARLSREDVTQVLRYSLCELSFADDGRGKYRVGGSNASCTCQSLQPCQWHDHPPDEDTCHEPPKCHNWK